MDFKISIAKYISDGIEQEIRAKDILTRELYYEKYSGNLYCKEPGCTAKLHHVEMNNGSKFFRTNSGKDNKHKDKCPSEVLYDGTTTYLTGNGEAVEVSDRHIKETLDRRRKAHKDKLEGKKKSYKPKEKKDNRKNKLPPRAIGVDNGVTVSINGKGKVSNDDRNTKGTKILGRTANEITKKDHGKVRCVDGYIRDIFIYDDYIQIEFMEKSEHKVFIEFGEAFKDNDISAFNGLKRIKDYIEYVKERGENTYCTCIGLVVKRNEKFIIEVYKEIEFQIEGEIITQFIIQNSDILTK